MALRVEGRKPKNRCCIAGGLGWGVLMHHEPAPSAEAEMWGQDVRILRPSKSRTELPGMQTCTERKLHLGKISWGPAVTWPRESSCQG